MPLFVGVDVRADRVNARETVKLQSANSKVLHSHDLSMILFHQRGRNKRFNHVLPSLHLQQEALAVFEAISDVRLPVLAELEVQVDRCGALQHSAEDGRSHCLPLVYTGTKHFYQLHLLIVVKHRSAFFSLFFLVLLFLNSFQFFGLFLSCLLRLFFFLFF